MKIVNNPIKDDFTLRILNVIHVTAKLNEFSDDIASASGLKVLKILKQFNS